MQGELYIPACAPGPRDFSGPSPPPSPPPPPPALTFYFQIRYKEAGCVEVCESCTSATLPTGAKHVYVNPACGDTPTLANTWHVVPRTGDGSADFSAFQVGRCGGRARGGRQQVAQHRWQRRAGVVSDGQMPAQEWGRQEGTPQQQAHPMQCRSEPPSLMLCCSPLLPLCCRRS